MGQLSLGFCLVLGVASFYFHDNREIIVKGKTAAWFQDTNLERVEWVNNILKELWPHVEKLLENLASAPLIPDGKCLMLLLKLVKDFVFRQNDKIGRKGDYV